jgi:hypothetical protein
LDIRLTSGLTQVSDSVNQALAHSIGDGGRYESQRRSENFLRMDMKKGKIMLKKVFS